MATVTRVERRLRKKLAKLTCQFVTLEGNNCPSRRGTSASFSSQPLEFLSLCQLLVFPSSFPIFHRRTRIYLLCRCFVDTWDTLYLSRSTETKLTPPEKLPFSFGHDTSFLFFRASTDPQLTTIRQLFLFSFLPEDCPVFTFVTNRRRKRSRQTRGKLGTIVKLTRIRASLGFIPGST